MYEHSIQRALKPSRLVGLFGWCLVVVFVLVGNVATAQDFEQLKPRTPDNVEGVPQLPDVPAPAVGSDRILVDEWLGVIFVDDAGKVVRDPAPVRGMHIQADRGLSVIRTRAAEDIVNNYLDGPISILQINEMVRELIILYRRFDQPVVDLSVPEQDITGGMVQIVVTEGRIGEIVVEGPCFFDPCMLVDQTCNRPGDIIYESLLIEDLRWLNRNPYREVDMRLRPGAAFGETDVIFEVYDRRPISVYAGYEDTGNRTLGLDRTLYGIYWGNVWGKDHSLGYQYTASNDFNSLSGHSMVYSIPLANRDILTVYGSFAEISALQFPGPQITDGRAWQASFRYYHDLCPGACEPRGCSQHRLFFGFDFKQTNTQLLLGQNVVFDATPDIAQLMVGYDVHWQDRWGLGAIGAEFYASPGQFSSGNTDPVFQAVRFAAEAEYYYARLYWDRRVWLPHCWSAHARVTGQFADGNLLSSEQLGFGGYDTVRGYDMRLINGDQGYIINLELLTPEYPFPWWSYCGQHIQGLVFWDYGNSRNHTLLPAERESITLNGAGVGVRASLGRSFYLRADYGWQLRDLGIAGIPDSRFHVSAVVTY